MHTPADPSAGDGPVTLLRRDQAEALVRASEGSGRLPWSDEAIEAAWALTHGHPYLLQHLCWHVWQRARGQVEASEKASRTKRCAVCGDTNPADAPKCRSCASETWHHVVRARRAVTRDDVEAALPATVDASRSTLERVWEALPHAMQAVAWVLAKAGPVVTPEERVRRLFARRGMLEAARDPAKAPRSVEGWDLLEAVDAGYRLRVDLLRRWIAALDPPDGALDLAEEEIDVAGTPEDAARPEPEARGEAPARRAAEPVEERAGAPRVVAGPPRIGDAEAAAPARGTVVAKDRRGRSVALCVGVAGLAAGCALLGWIARGGLGGTSTATPGASATAATASVAAPAEAPAAAEDGSDLPPGRGYLVVDAPRESAVFAFGTFVGLTGRKLEVSCGTKFLRLAEPPADGSGPPAQIVWTSPGKSVNVACKALTRVSLTPTK